MRIVRNIEEFEENLEACKREALNSFKDDRVLLERYIVRPRHIEFQVFADKFGNAVYLYERDCSVQRRHQKVLEEAPAPGMTEKLRSEMGKAATDAAKAVGYVGAGTVEFIFDAETNEYFFMEMNTRLQVEHPVTEMIMRKDLVQWQLVVASGHKLPIINQSELKSYGHAIEARVYAENPNNNFLPATGKLIHLKPPQSSSTVRVESGVRSGDEVSIYYDPMIAKLIVWGPNRAQSLARMYQALSQYQIVGPPNNIPFLMKCVGHPAFLKGQVETGFIAQNIKDLIPPQSDVKQDQLQATIATLALLIRQNKSNANNNTINNSDIYSPWNNASNKRFNIPNTDNARDITLLKLYYNNEGELTDTKFNMKIYDNNNSTDNKNNRYNYIVNHGDKNNINISGAFAANDPTLLHVTIGSQTYAANVIINNINNNTEISVFVDGAQSKFKFPTVSFSGTGGANAGCVSPMAGKIVKVLVKPNDKVKKGQQLIIMEAMKMEHIIRAPNDGIIQEILYNQTDFVEGGKLLIKFQQKEK